MKGQLEVPYYNILHQVVAVKVLVDNILICFKRDEVSMNGHRVSVDPRIV